MLARSEATGVIHIWLDLPVYLIFSVLTVFYGLSAVAIYLIQFHSPARPLIMTAAGVVAPYFGAVGVLFALLTGFLGAEVAERNRQAARSVLAESSALDTLTTLSRAAGGDGAAIRVAERGYVENVLNKEWELLGSDEASPATSSALRAIFDAVAKPAIASTAGAPLQNSLLNAAVRISTSRAERLALGADRTYELKWACVLLLGLLTRLASIPLLINICVALYSTKIVTFAKNGFWGTLHEARTDVSMLLGLVFLLIAGGGAWSLDARLAGRGESRRA